MDKFNFVILKNSKKEADEPFRMNVNTIHKYRKWYDKGQSRESTLFYIIRNPIDKLSSSAEQIDNNCIKVILPISIEEVDKAFGVVDLRENQ